MPGWSGDHSPERKRLQSSALLRTGSATNRRRFSAFTRLYRSVMKSPIVTHSMQDRHPHAPDRRQQLVVFNLRAYEFWSHPYFSGDVNDCPLRIIFESLVFRLRPIAMTDSDDASLWRALENLEAETGDSEKCAQFRKLYNDWFLITDEALQSYLPLGHSWSTEPPAGSALENWTYRPPPVQELWDRVFGDGPHSDFRRILANKATDWPAVAALGADWHMARMLAVISAIRPLIVEVHDNVLEVVSQ